MAQAPGSLSAAGGQRVSFTTPGVANDHQTEGASTVPSLSSAPADETNRSALQAWFAPAVPIEASEFGQVTLVRKKPDAVIAALKEEQGREGAHASTVLVKITPPPLGPSGSREHYIGRVQSEKMQLKLLAGDGFPCFRFNINVRDESGTLAVVPASGTTPDLTCEVTRERLFEDGRAVQHASLNWRFPIANAVVVQEMQVQWRGGEKCSASQVPHAHLPLKDSVISQGASANPSSGENS